MAKHDAEVTVGADTSEVERAFAKASDAAHRAAGDLTASMGGAAKNVAESLASIVTEAGKINFASQHQGVREFEGATAKLAISMGKNLGEVRNTIEETGVSLGKRPQEVAAWISQVGKLSYSFEDAGDSIRGMSELAAKTGRNTEDYAGLAVSLSRMGVAGKDTSSVLGVLASQADKLGTVGGVAAFADQIDAAGEALTHFSIKGSDGLQRVTGFLGMLGKGLDAASAQRVQQSALGALSGDPRRWERFLGHDILDEKGHVQDPAKIYKEIYAKASRKFTDPRELRIAMLNNFGPELGSALLTAGKTGGFDQIGKLSALAPSNASAAALAGYQKTEAGERDKAAAELAKSSRELSGSSTALGKAADALESFASKSPLTSQLTGALAGAAGKFGLERVGKLLTGAIKGGTAGAIESTAGKAGLSLLGAVAPVLGIAGAAAGGIGIGALAGKALLEKDVFGQDEGDKQRLEGATEEVRLAKARRDQARALRSKMGLNIKLPSAEETEAMELGSKQTEAKAAADSARTNVFDTKALEMAMQKGLSGMKFNIVNSTGGPIEITDQSGQSVAAGSQLSAK